MPRFTTFDIEKALKAAKPRPALIVNDKFDLVYGLAPANSVTTSIDAIAATKELLKSKSGNLKNLDPATEVSVSMVTLQFWQKQADLIEETPTAAVSNQSSLSF